MIRRPLLALVGPLVDHPWRTLLGAVVVLLLALPGLGRVSITGDLHRMIPERTDASRGMALWLEGFTTNEAVYGLVEIPDGAPTDTALLIDFGEHLAERLEASELVTTARSSPAEGLPATDPLFVLGLLDATGRAELQERMRPEGIAARARGLRDLLSGPLGKDARDLLVRDPFGLLELLGRHVGRGVQRLEAGGGGFISPDGRALLLVVRTARPAGGKVPFATRVVEELRAAVDDAVATHPRGAELVVGLTGSHVYAHEIEAATRADATMLSIVSILAVLLVYLGFYRSFHSLGTMLLLLPYSAALTLGFLVWGLGELTPMAAGFAAIVFGLGVDPAIHLTSRYREALTELPGPEAARRAVAAVGPAVCMASLTSAAALQGMGVLGSKALLQMSVLAGSGVLINAAVMLLVLPALWMVLGPRIGPDAGVGIGPAKAWSRFVRRRSGLVIAAFALAAAAVAARAEMPGFEVSLDGFRPPSLQPVQVDRALDRHFGEDAGKIMVFLRGEDEEAVLRANDAWADALRRLEHDGAIRRYESLEVLHPSRATVEARRAELRASVDLVASADAMQAALQEVGFRPEPFAPALERLRAFGRGEPLDGLVSNPEWLAWFEEKHVSRVHGDLRVATHVHRSEDGPVRVLYNRLVASTPDLPEGVESFVIGLPIIEAQAESALAFGTPLLLAASVLVLLGVLGLHYRRVRVVLVAAGPLVGALLLFVGLYGATGTPISFFAMAAIPLLIGVGIDDHLFMMDRYFEDGREGSLDETLAGAGRAVLVTTLTTLAAFGVLSLSRFDALASMGRGVAAALGLAFAASVILLPALIARYLPGTDE